MSPKRALSCSARLFALALLLAFAAPRVSTAQEWTLSPGVTVEQWYDDNVFSDGSDERWSWVTIAEPSLSLKQRDDRGTFEVLGDFRSRNYWRFSDLNALDYSYGVRLDRKLTRRIEIDFRAHEEHYDKRDDVFADTEESELLEGARPDLTRRWARLGTAYALSPRTKLGFEAEIRDDEYDRNEIASRSGLRDRQRRQGRVSIDRRMSPVDEASLVLRLERSESEPVVDTGGILDRDNNLIGTDLAWTRRWSPRWTSETRVGYTWMRNELSDVPLPCTPGSPGCPGSGVVFRDATDRTSGVVGSVTLTREFARGEIEFGYEQDRRTSGGSSGSSGVGIDVTRYWFGLDHRLNRRFVLSFDVSYTDQDSDSSFDENLSTLDVEQFRTRLRVNYRLRGNVSMYGELNFYDQDASDRRNSSYTRRRASIGFRYTFDKEL